MSVSKAADDVIKFEDTVGKTEDCVYKDLVELTQLQADAFRIIDTAAKEVANLREVKRRLLKLMRHSVQLRTRLEARILKRRRNAALYTDLVTTQVVELKTLAAEKTTLLAKRKLLKARYTKSSDPIERKQLTNEFNTTTQELHTLLDKIRTLLTRLEP